ncbi:SET domain-containing protein-lysine N-methyltransferase [Candidatus Albibeggiatoa sp. nov. BB20]|uniref:SET domain-containing protein-lysine N-methyltransferase n=1 Tax=Candidatus Albibeggiatoa sp. nov. BB20 TaxID=3162723 RepID=UPI003365A203
MIAVQLFPNKGRGVVATTTIPKDTVIERVPSASFPAEQRAMIDSTSVAKYYFVLPSEYEQHDNIDGYFVFGLSSLCNHKETPNAYIKWIKTETGLWAHLIALQDIKMDQEVSLFYTNVDEYQFNN